ncbi:Ribosomal protein L11 methyltransferase [Tsuneonella dongtanensis]|uniref:Ribosomal protein L11 methyltransferase n=1 Tax=Tsuneonella dongtanensis TaxID=692370 RepID=A0A1B2AE80_9SPHN|nr:50S ribosomal protein L11 methyltransferase [Tsuneonella dongtanensis]ANY20446.1 Ribosomal protein L11 methyltransferase [Tsuneonella dongtanensis]
MADSWTIRAEVPREAARAALLAHEEADDWPPEWVLVGMEMADDRPEDWFVEVYLPHRPSAADKRRVAALFGNEPPRLTGAKVVPQDWVTASQQGLEPIVAGPFRVRTADFVREPGTIDFVIPASQAFGTGHHATTEGCLAMLAAMKARGTVVRNLADIGTGTGLLAFAALALWPRALATASDIDPVCTGVVEDNARANGIPLGARAGALTMVIADGMDDALLRARGPYDLLIANILAGPLVELAPDFATAVPPGGNLLLAGLLETQEAKVRAAYRRAGFRLAARLVKGDWSILWLRRRSAR